MSDIPIREFEFELPRGLVDAEGRVHRAGRMRLTTARDEIWLQTERRAQENQAYGVLVLLSRVITQLGTLPAVTPEVLEALFSLDLAYLREFYNRVNHQGDATIPVQCPLCSGQFKVELSLAGES